MDGTGSSSAESDNVQINIYKYKYIYMHVTLVGFFFFILDFFFFGFSSAGLEKNLVDLATQRRVPSAIFAFFIYYLLMCVARKPSL